MLTGTDAPADLLRSLTAELGLVASTVERVEAVCRGLRAQTAGLADEAARAVHAQLLPLLAQPARLSGRVKADNHFRRLSTV